MFSDDQEKDVEIEEEGSDGSTIDDALPRDDLIAKEASSIGDINLQDELWRIFTFYTLHTDSANLEAMKTSLFVKLCKDVQITSNKFTGTQIELELAKILRQLRGTEVRVGGTFISFVEFLAVLEGISPKVYPNCPVDVACRRLLLENVLLLAGRRSESANFDLSNEEASMFLNGPIRRSLEDIFKHYVSLAEIHRTARDTGKQATGLGASKKISLQELRSQVTFREYHQFCLDYNLKTASLLTGMHIGHIFLSAVPLEEHTKTCQGMTIDMFVRSIVHAALIAFRQVSNPIITPLLKVKALLLHMWRTVNKSENSIKAVQPNAKVFSSSSPNYNLYGSSVFSDHFLKIWMADHFRDYVVVKDSGASEEGGDVVARIALDNSAMGSGDAGGGDGEAQHGVFTPEDLTEHEEATTDAAKLINAIALDNAEHEERKTSEAWGSKFAPGSTVTIKGTDLDQLLKTKPEIAELLILELSAMSIGR